MKLEAAWVFAGALALALVGCDPQVGPRAAGAGQLDAPWLEGSPAITGERLEELAALARPDPDATAIFAEARQKLGNGSLATVASRMTICPDDTQEGGLTLVESEAATLARPLQFLVEGKDPPYPPQVQAWLAEPARDRKRFEEPDAVVFEMTRLPKVCFVRTLTVGAAYDAVIHELVHALRYDAQGIGRLAETSPDEASFLRAAVLAPGGEVEAYRISTRARTRLGGGSDVTALLHFVRPAVLQSMDDAALADLILAPAPRGLGYADGILRGRYAEAREGRRSSLTARRRVLTAMLDERTQNIAVADQRAETFAYNVGVHEHNAGIARRRGDAAHEASIGRELAQAKEELAMAKRVAEVGRASEIRLRASIADVDRSLAILGAR